MAVLVTGCAGYDGSLKIYRSEALGKYIRKRYPERFFGVFAASVPEDSVTMQKLYETALSEERVVDASEGGVLAALWKLMKQNRTGGAYSLREIPVRQQTIEICELFGLNPYRLSAPSCRVWLTKSEAETREILSEAATAGVPSAVIGFTAKGAAIRRLDVEGESSLRRPEEDEIKKLPDLEKEYREF